MKKYKKSDPISYTLGTTLTLELLNKKKEDITAIYIHSKQEQNETYHKITSICNDNHIEVIYNDKIFNILSDKENCYVIGVFNKYKTHIDYSANHIVLVNPSNTGNLGTIIRSAVGFGINNLVIIKPSVDIFDPKVIRGSMGALFNINFTYYNDFSEYYDLTNKSHTYYSFMLNGKCSLDNVKKDERYSLIFGPEASGLDASYLEIGESIVIKHSSEIDSLNLDNAVSIALYEFTKGNFK